MKQVTILQIPTESRDRRKFMPFNSKDFDPSIYTEVYSGTMDVEDAEDVYMRLQWTKPQGYKGHSLSVSDLVQMDGKTYFCDSFGFKDVTDKMEKTL